MVITMDSQIITLLINGIGETVYMTLGSAILAYAFGLPLGVILFVTDRKSIWQNRPLNTILGVTVNILRSVPFIILLVWLMPFTRAVVGTTVGSTPVLVPLVVSAAPFVARMVESSLKEVDKGVIEAAQSMGAGNMRIILRVMLPEARPSLIVGSTIAVTTILGYSAMAGFTGGGGLGAIAVNYGYYRYDTAMMNVTLVLMVIIVQIFQEVGMRCSKKTDKRGKS